MSTRATKLTPVALPKTLKTTLKKFVSQIGPRIETEISAKIAAWQSRVSNVKTRIPNTAVTDKG